MKVLNQQQVAIVSGGEQYFILNWETTLTGVPSCVFDEFYQANQDKLTSMTFGEIIGGIYSAFPTTSIWIESNITNLTLVNI